MGNTGVSPVHLCLPAADPVPGGLLQSPGPPGRYLKTLESGGLERARCLTASFPAAGSLGSEALSKIVDFYPEDNNSLQISCFSGWVG